MKMAEQFNWMKRSGELIEQGYSDEEAVAILEKEEAESGFSVLDDGAWWQVLEEAKAEVDAEIDAEEALMS